MESGSKLEIFVGHVVGCRAHSLCLYFFTLNAKTTRQTNFYMAPLKQKNLFVTKMTFCSKNYSQPIVSKRYRRMCETIRRWDFWDKRERVSWQIWFVSILYFPFSEILYSNFSVWFVTFFYHRLAYHNCFMVRATNFYSPYRKKSVLDFPFSVPSLFWFYYGKAW